MKKTVGRIWVAGLASCAASALFTLAIAAPAAADPLDLSDPTPRDVAVRFEISPRDRPGALDGTYTPLLPARLEGTDVPGIVRIVIAGAIVEEHLLRDRSPKPESFGDFVWHFDTATGQVLDARVEGVVIESIDWGFTTSQTEARIRVVMSTREAAGYLPAQRVFGHRVFRFCDDESRGCSHVGAVAFDPERGYVNAVGSIDVEASLGLGAVTFSPLGEALFLEDPEALEARDEGEDEAPLVAEGEGATSLSIVSSGPPE